MIFEALCQYPGCTRQVEGVNPKQTPRYCKEHLKLVRTQLLEKGRRSNYKRILSKEIPPGEEVQGADGLSVRLESEAEREFYEARKKQYKTDFDWNISSDGNLLQRLLALELESRRIERELSYTRSKTFHKKRQTTEKTRLLIKLSEEIRQLERDLGITREQRLKSREEKDAVTLFNELFAQYEEFKNRKIKGENLIFNEKEKYWGSEKVEDGKKAEQASIVDGKNAQVTINA